MSISNKSKYIIIIIVSLGLTLVNSFFQNYIVDAFMSEHDIKALRQKLELTSANCAKFLGFKSTIDYLDIENKKMPDKSRIFERLAIVDSQIEELVLRELEVFNFKQKTEIILLRYLNNDDFFLYDPEIAETLKIVELHKNLINRVRNGLANIGKTVKLVFMDSNYYEQWLSVNDFEDSPDIRIFWGSEQIKNISKS